MPTQDTVAVPTLAGHGVTTLTTVQLDTYNAELRDNEGFIGDRASARAFRAILADERERVRHGEEDPIGEESSEHIRKKKLDKLMVTGDPAAAGVVLGTIEEFAQEFATVIRRFLKLKDWRGTERIVVGGGLRNSRVGELAIGRTAVLLKADAAAPELVPIRHDPDEAGLIGCIHLAPSWIFAGHDGLLAVDIGGSNIRVGIVEFNLRRAKDLSKSSVWTSDLWRHADDRPDREDAVARLILMLETLIKRAAKDKLRLAPFVGIGCPGLITAAGTIEKGGQNLPGDWEHKDFNLPALLRDAIPTLDGHKVTVLMHNDAVVQGLSESPFMRDVTHWGVMTLGTGLGNARFTNHPAAANT
ncbi:MAG: ROK family protein [Pseudomonadota bacterium]|nr:ROK family protein [Pseudomonadota bacterium]